MPIKKTIFFLCFSLVIFAIYSEVNNDLTDEDLFSISNDYYLGINSSNYDKEYEKQIDDIKKIQKSVFLIAPKMKSIPKNASREPADLAKVGSGYCHDRSRVIEKILRSYGYKTRHIAIYSKEKTKTFFKTLIAPKIDSHAITEVLTKKGWLVIDSNSPWLSLDIDNNPISIKQISDNKDQVIKKLPNGFPSFIYELDFLYIYGLYSRHGKFFPPHNFFPDINYSEFLYNFYSK